nr:hypothetical protein [Mycoplasmopsis bovis]
MLSFSFLSLVVLLDELSFDDSLLGAFLLPLLELLFGSIKPLLPDSSSFITLVALLVIFTKVEFLILMLLPIISAFALIPLPKAKALIVAS